MMIPQPKRLDTVAIRSPLHRDRLLQAEPDAIPRDILPISTFCPESLILPA
ncbi:MAG: hypothetical protein HC860_06075 [Alkalinema sp. RU_4_3]|nr:hypothetical protein [Alkalinema sp. RU_4_3]